jgi:hypothetical protein
MRDGPPGVEPQESWGTEEGVGVAFPGVAVGLGDPVGVGERETWDVGVGETGDVDEGVAIPVDLDPQPAAIVITTTSPRTDLALRLDHFLK